MRKLIHPPPPVTGNHVGGERGNPAHDDEPTIQVAIEELDGELALAGEEPSAREMQRAIRTVELLSGILPRLTDEEDAAAVGTELGEILGWPLGANDEALAALREAHQRAPHSLGAARGYRKSALRAGSSRDLVIALEGEVKLRGASARAVLECERAALLEGELGNAAAARLGYQRALEHDATNLVALAALERLALGAGDLDGAAELAQRQAVVVTDGALKAEHLARAARHSERAGEGAPALALAIEAQVHSPSSPAVSFLCERLWAARGAWADICQLRAAQIASGAIAADEGWFDVGIIARYRLQDAALAERAFAQAAEWLDDDEVEPCLDELWSLLEQGARERELLALGERSLACARDSARRAHLWQRIAAAHEALGEPTLAAEAYERALEEQPADPALLELAGRLFIAVGARDRLLRMHRREAAAATSHAQAGRALCRAGEILIDDPTTRDEGIGVLRQALTLLPADARALAALERALREREDWRTLVDLFEYEIEVGEDGERRGWLLGQVGLLAADRLEDRARAVVALRASLALAPAGPPWSLVRLAELLEQQGDLDALAPVLEQLAEHAHGASQRATALGRVAAVHEARGALDDAFAAYRRALALAPPRHPVHAAAGRALLRAGRHAQLLEVLAAGARDAAPEEQARWLWRSAIVLDRPLCRVDEAIEVLTRACTLAPDDDVPRAALAALLRREGRWEALSRLAASRLGTSVDGAADAEQGAALLEAAILAEANDDPGAADAYRRALAAGNRLARLPLARLLARSERWEELEAHYALLGSTPTASMHARYRAGEIAAERRERARDAAAHFLAAHEAVPEALAPLVGLQPLLGHVGGEGEILAKLASLTSDRVTRMAALRRQAALHHAAGALDEALALRLELLEIEPLDADAGLRAELELERRCDRVRLADLWRRVAAAPRLEPGLVAHAHAALGNVLEQLGLLRDAAQAYEAARAAALGAAPRTTLIALRRLYDALADPKVGVVLAELAARPPVLEQSLCLRVLAGWHLERGDQARAAAALEQALALHPRDYDALNELLDIAAGAEVGRCTDAVLRAFELEEDPAVLVPLGAALAARLLVSHRHAAAADVVERVLAHAPDDLPALMLQAEVHEQRGSWRAAADHLWRVAGHPLAGARARLEALRRAATIHAREAPNAERAHAALAQIRELGLGDDEAREVERSVAALVADAEAPAP